jgi:hypothetical protein
MRPHQSSRHRRQDPADRPLDRALARIGAHGLPYRLDATRFDTWHAMCPYCRTPDWTLTIRERGRGGEIGLRCAAGCTDAEIRDALERDPADARIEAAETAASEAWAILEQLRTLATEALELAAGACEPVRLAAPRPLPAPSPCIGPPWWSSARATASTILPVPRRQRGRSDGTKRRCTRDTCWVSNNAAMNRMFGDLAVVLLHELLADPERDDPVPRQPPWPSRSGGHPRRPRGVARATAA